MTTLSQRGQSFPFLDGIGVVWFDRDRNYRYLWGHVWPGTSGGGMINWIMLNPSTADETNDDPTLRRCRGFSQAWGYGSMLVTNLYALRSPRPSAIQRSPDPVGPLNDIAIEEAAKSATCVVVAWGNHGWWLGRDQIVLDKLRGWGIEPYCLGVTQQQRPRHPLRMRRDTPLVTLREAIG